VTWTPPPAFDGIPTQGGGRTKTTVRVLIEGWIGCTGCGNTWQATSHTETQPEHVPNEIVASQFTTNSRALVHAQTCTAPPTKEPE